jgi:hypothetical protein
MQLFIVLDHTPFQFRLTFNFSALRQLFVNLCGCRWPGKYADFLQKNQDNADLFIRESPSIFPPNDHRPEKLLA